MSGEVLFKSESGQSREEIALYLHAVAEKLERGDAITLTSGSESVTMEPPARPAFEDKAELEWDENSGNGGERTGQLEIE
ncbi:amphi-Trp domain-containing protein [Halorarum halophilum]|uniref:Amphi-Trp domain-containing protein n=1 Tax=Halorarum halophilum TaxID=2743090 RepID=A0A7D5GGB8_9EURY|nr:amphi-Trp domain-containing protein [Halobaculum halophilum]QLG28948.1 amphi-Trp domain-containing protein [Halobaculum halophilum]